MKNANEDRKIYFILALRGGKLKFAGLFSLIFLAALVLFAVQEVQAGATMTVNANGDNTFCDDVLTLREAILLGKSQMSRALTQGERNQIGGDVIFIIVPPSTGCPGTIGYSTFGGIGGSFADDIFFSNDVNSILPSPELPDIGSSDDIDGLKPNGSKVVLSGVNASPSANGLNLFINGRTGSQIRNLIIRDFGGNGIFGYRDVNGAIFEGLEIYANGANGIWISGVNFGSFGVNPRNNRIGGTQPQQRNYIYSNGQSGIAITGITDFDRDGDMGNVIENNYIGLNNDSANQNVGNNGQGIYMENAFGNLIGGDTTASRNFISGNFDGIQIHGTGSYGNRIINNILGRGSNFPVMGFGNRASGVSLDNVGQGGGLPNQIGEASKGNVISGNAGFGIWMSGGGTSKNIVQGNYIGTNVGANDDIGNAADGIYFVNGATENQIGGTGSGQGNVIFFNRNGIYVESGTKNRFRGNRIFVNDVIGIDLAPAGVTPNDSMDVDTGANNLQNYPVLSNINGSSTNIRITGTLHSTPGRTFTIDFFGNSSCDVSGFGEGRTFLGSKDVGTDSQGNADIDVTFLNNISNAGQCGTATATDTDGNTSEFSRSITVGCSYTLSHTLISVSPGGITSSVGVTTTSTCLWVADSFASWVRVTSGSSGTGSGNVNFSVDPNTGPFRTGTLTIAGQTFTVQQSSGCQFTLNPSSRSFNASGGIGSIGLTASNGACGWTASVGSSGAGWVNLTSVSSGTGNGTVNYSVTANTGPARSGTIIAGGQVFNITQAAGSVRRARFDYDGDGKTDISIFRPSNGQWWINRSTSGVVAAAFGLGSDKIAPADFTGDGRTDIAFWRPSTGEWFVLRSEDNTFFSLPFGLNGDIPAPADFDGDGKADPAVFRPSNATWYIQRSGDGGTTFMQFGANGDVPVAADYDGDGRADIAIFRPSNGQWWLLRSTAGIFATTFGTGTDKPSPSDFTGDGRADIVFFRPSTGEWFVQRSEDSSYFSFPFGTNGDIPATGDYDADGRADAAIFRPSTGTWYISATTQGVIIQGFGINGDRPTPSAFVP